MPLVVCLTNLFIFLFLWYRAVHFLVHLPIHLSKEVISLHFKLLEFIPCNFFLESEMSSLKGKTQKPISEPNQYPGTT
jgi:hypothetical protein